MAITLKDAMLNAQTDYDPAVINEFRKHSVLMDLMPFKQAVNPSGGGDTLTYGYRRLVSQRSASFRKINTEYTPAEVKTESHSVTLVPLGGSFDIDRVIAHVGPAASDEVALQTSATVEATTKKFVESVINGDKAVEEDGFDGLDKALKNSTTEITEEKDWQQFTDAAAGLRLLDDLDELLDSLDKKPTVLIGNKRAVAKLRSAARAANMYTQKPIEGLVDEMGREIMRDFINGVAIIDAGEKPGSNQPIIPIQNGLTSLYAVRLGLDGFHGVTTTTGQLVKTWLPDFSTAGAVKKGEVEMGPVAVALKSTKAAAVLRKIRVSAS